MAKKEGIVFSDNMLIAYLEGSRATVNLSKSKAPYPTSPLMKESGSRKIAYWGDDNLFPQTVIEECSKNTLIPTTLDWKARALYGGGVMTGKTTYDAKGEEIFTPEIFPVVRDFFKRSNLKRYFIEGCSDFYWFQNVFPEMILSRDRKEIVSMVAQETTYCRWEKQNPATGLIENCYINANWDNGGTENNSIIVPVLDPYYDPVNNLREDKRGFKYIYPISYPSPGKTYYQLAHWNSLRESGWLDVAQAIPQFKKALMKNQMSIKYHIEIADYWWEWKFPNWKSMKPEDRKTKTEAELTKINDWLTGQERAGTSVVTTFKSDPQTGKEYAGWKITAVDDKVKDGMYIEDSQEASSHLLYALGVDGTMIGTAPGKNMGAGSGSDKRVAFNIYISLADIHKHILLEPLEFIRDYNGWDPDIEFRFKNNLITTLDTGKETTTTAGK